MKRTRPGQVRVPFLAACAGVLGLALAGVLIVAFSGDSTSGLILGMGLLLAGALGGLGLGLLMLMRRPEPGPEGRRTSLALICALLGAAVGAMGSPVWVLPLIKKAQPGAADSPFLWVASVVVGLAVGALVGVLASWLIRTRL